VGRIGLSLSLSLSLSLLVYSPLYFPFSPSARLFFQHGVSRFILTCIRLPEAASPSPVTSGAPCRTLRFTPRRERGATNVVVVDVFFRSLTYIFPTCPDACDSDICAGPVPTNPIIKLCAARASGSRSSEPEIKNHSSSTISLH